MLIVFTVLAVVGYPVVFEIATRGRSLGKMALGLRVVSDDGGPERFRQALFRALAGFIEIWMFTGGPAVICSLVSARGKRIGDVFAGTMVISERAPKISPPPLDAAAAGVVGVVAPAVRSAARAGRAGAPVPVPRGPAGARVPRRRWAYRIYAEVVAQISPPPPPGAPGRTVLAAVLAERHRRELGAVAARRTAAVRRRYTRPPRHRRTAARPRTGAPPAPDARTARHRPTQTAGTGSAPPD